MRLISCISIILFCLSITVPSLADTVGQYTCEEFPKDLEPDPDFNFNSFSIWHDQKSKELRSRFKYHYHNRQYTAYSCTYTDGKIFKERYMGDIFVFSGFWDHCSQGGILLFNKKTKVLTILSKPSLKTSRSFNCKIGLPDKTPN